MQVETITPTQAREWLEKNHHNRPLHRVTVDKYVEAMRNGQWVPNGETIKFSKENRLLDGQHRLAACVESGVTIKSFVVRELPESVFDTIDTGKNKSIGDLLALSGEVNQSHLGVALRLQYINDELGSIAEFATKVARLVTNRDLMQTYKKHPNMVDSVAFIVGIRGISQIITIPNAAYCHYQFSLLDPKYHADTFFSRLIEKTDVPQKGEPIYELKSRLDRLSRNSMAARVEIIALTIKAFNAFRAQKEVKNLYYDKGDTFPMPV